MSSAKAEAFYEQVKSDEHRVWFIVALKENDRAIGEAGLLRMFPAWRTTDLSIIIGEREAWGAKATGQKPSTCYSTMRLGT
jgi:RimJ/RimL family protein N-acetyltransferase